MRTRTRGKSVCTELRSSAIEISIRKRYYDLKLSFAVQLEFNINYKYKIKINRVVLLSKKTYNIKK
jgi:hypothetical protein